MKAIRSFLLIVALAMGLSDSAVAQTALNQVRLNSAITSETQTAVTLTVADNVTVGDLVYVDTEAMVARAVNTTTDVVTVSRGQMGTAASQHLTGAIVWTGAANRFYFSDPPYGRCIAASAYPGGYQPWINVLTGTYSYCNDNLFGNSSVAGNWQRTTLASYLPSVLHYTPIAYRTSRTSAATVILPAYSAKLTDVLIASLTYSGPFEVFLPSPTGLLGKKLTIADAAGLNSNAATSTAGRTITIRGLFENGDNTKTLARWEHFEAQPGFTTERLVGAYAATDLYVIVTASSNYYWQSFGF
mgnify:CR=1 FL=1